VPLDEAMIYLRRMVRRRFGSKVVVTFYNENNYLRTGKWWENERPLPLIIIDGKVVFRGTMPLGDIIRELEELENMV